MDRFMALPEHAGVGDVSEPSLACSRVRLQDREGEKTWLGMHRMLFVPVGSCHEEG